MGISAANRAGDKWNVNKKNCIFNGCLKKLTKMKETQSLIGNNFFNMNV